MVHYYFSYFLDSFPQWSLAGYASFFAICLACYTGLMLLAKKRQWDKVRVSFAFILIIYILYVYYAAFLSREVSEEFKNYLFRPFWSYRRPMIFIRDQIVREIIANVLIFIPIGIALPIIVKKKKILITLLSGFSFSVFIELSQLVTHKGFTEFDDIFHNTIGVVLGLIIYYIFYLIFQKRKVKNEGSK